MGLWKRVTERTKQTFGVKATTGDWKPTSNARNVAMIEEARKFSKQLKTLYRELKHLESTIGGSMVVFQQVLNAPLPRAYEITDKGPVPMAKESVPVGAGVAFDVLTAATTDLKTRLQQEVLHPLDQWQAAYRSIKARNEKCEELRLELDAKRREASAMAVTLNKQKTRVAANAAAAEAAANAANQVEGSPNKFEDQEFKLQKEEDKVTRLTQRYKDIEGEVFNALLTLITDTQVLKQYAATALVVYQNAFTQAYGAFPEGGAAGNVYAIQGSPPPAIQSSPSRNVMLSSGGSPLPDINKGSPGSVGGALPPSTVSYPAGMSPLTPPPITPDGPVAPPAPGAPPPVPEWYSEARKNAKPTNLDSDDD